MFQFEHLTMTEKNGCTIEADCISKNAGTSKISTILGKYFLLFILLCSSTAGLFAQDIITKKDGTEIQVKVTEIGTSEVKYTRFGTTLPTYTLLKSEIFMIKYEDGAKDIFDAESIQTQTNLPIYKYTFGNTINPIGGTKSAWGSGIASFFIPGLGQFINGDVGGGFFFLGTNIACNLLWMNSFETDYYGNISVNTSQFTIGFLGALATNIWSIVNASQIAKRVNLVRGYQLGNNTFLKVEPVILETNSFAQQSIYNSTYGMALRITF